MSKKNIVLLSLIIPFFNVCMLIGGCNIMGSFFKSDRQIMNEQMEKLIEVMEKKDKVTLRELFSKNVKTLDADFEENIDYLFKYYEGELIMYDDGGCSPYVSEKIQYGNKRKLLSHSYEVITSVREYRIMFQYIEVDTTEPNNEGIWTFYVIRTEDDKTVEEGWSYGGDGKDSPGLNIHIENSYMWE